MQIAFIKVFGISCFGFGGYCKKFDRIADDFLIIQRIFAVRVAQRAVNIIQIQIRFLEKEISKTHVFFTERIFRIKRVVPFFLPGYVGGDICTSRRYADTKVKLNVLI